MEIRTRISKCKDDLRRLVNMVDQDSPKTRLPTEVTCVIPVYNSFLSLPRVLYHLEPGAQSTPISLLICDNTSQDPFGVLLSESNRHFISWLVSRGFTAAQILPAVTRVTQRPDGTPMAPQEIINTNLETVWKKLTMAVTTPYILYVDADVLLPTGAVRMLLETIKSDLDLAMLGCQYEVVTDHVKMGATICRTEVMRETQWESIGCPCRFITKYLKSQGYKVEHLPGVYATHLKREVG